MLNCKSYEVDGAVDIEQPAAPPRQLPPMLHAPPAKSRKMLELPAPEPKEPQQKSTEQIKKEPKQKAKSRLYQARPKIETWIICGSKLGFKLEGSLAL